MDLAWANGHTAVCTTLAVLASLLLGASFGASSAAAAARCTSAPDECTLADAADRHRVWIGGTYDLAAGERPTLAHHFNSVTAENAMKWGTIEPKLGERDYSRADAVARFAHRTGLRLRGHALVWGRYQLPSDLEEDVTGAADPAARMQELMGRNIRTLVKRYRGRVAAWDVVNEPLEPNGGELDPNLFLRTIGPGYVGDAFRMANRYDPDADLFLNEFLFSYDGAKADALPSLVSDLLDEGVPIDGVGIQAHFFPFMPLPSAKELERYLRRLARPGLKVELTELDVSIWHFLGEQDPLAAQADYYHRIVSACMDVRRCRGVTVWGIADDQSWLDTFPPFSLAAPNLPLLFDSALRPKPAYAAVRSAVRERNRR